MPLWSIVFIDGAEDDLKKFDERIQDRIIEKFEWLEENFDRTLPLPLSNVLRGYFKLRIGDARVIYTVETEMRTLTIRAIGPRDKIYKRFGALV
ncbi:type II toxin-antitoxin system RelE/ParE family toxin [Candidatus Uhrbacteria bacterium]|nr:type II toxin-antitoxin system RelE/ParE family toxin [Candidatus Uhrbacteria bacterium]